MYSYALRCGYVNNVAFGKLTKINSCEVLQNAEI